MQVGYLLGLGDRHPSNLMLDRYSGKLLHIDFGDCFEASMHREKFPEKAQRLPYLNYLITSRACTCTMRCASRLVAYAYSCCNGLECVLRWVSISFCVQVPFRLTRMMINAMEVSGVEGNFRCALTCSTLTGSLGPHALQGPHSCRHHELCPSVFWCA